jgi:hypothetical protein
MALIFRWLNKKGISKCFLWFHWWQNVIYVGLKYKQINVVEALIMERFRLNLLIFCGIVFFTANIATGTGVITPPNDDCANAKPVGNVTNLAFDTTNATFDGPGLYIRSPNLWYCYTATCTGCATVSLRGSSFDTKIAVYRGCDCNPESEDLMRRNDDFYGHQSQVTFPAIKNNQYLIEVGGFNNTVKGQGMITISCDPQSSPPANDDCVNARWISNVTELPFSTICASFDGPGYYYSSPNLWYRYMATSTDEVTVSLLGSDYDTALAVYDTGDCYPKREDLIERNDDFGGLVQSAITFDAVASRTYLFEVLGYNTDEVGEGVITVSSTGGQPPSTNNDDCQNAKPISEVTDLHFDTTTATPDGSHLCMNSSNLWYCYTASCTGEATVSLAGSSYDTMLAVYDGCECYPAQNDLIECNDDTDGSRQSEITFDAIAGNQYLIEVGGYGLEAGSGVLNVSCDGIQPPPSSKDDCQNAKPVGDVKNMAFTTADATFDGPGLCMTGPNIWYCYTATCSGNVTVNLAGSSYDTMLAVYDGCQCYPSANDLIECNDDAGNSYQSEVTFAANIGDRYLIEIGGYGNEKGAGLLTISCEGVVVQNKPDLGDAPDSTNHSHVAMRAYAAQGSSPAVQANYPTVYNDGSGTGPFGPVHLNAQVVAYLGNKITRETEADTGTDEDGVNNIRPSSNTPDRDQGDDGVVFPLNMPNCRYTTIDYVVNVIDPDADLWLNVWLDWNRDGDWDDTLDCPRGHVPEWAVQNQYLFNLHDGLNQITSPAFLSWHPDNGRKEIWMRITLSGQPWRTGSNPGAKGNAGSGPEGKYAIGETEDYKFTPDVSASICEDYNDDGVIDLDDLATYTSEWLENCP